MESLPQGPLQLPPYEHVGEGRRQVGVLLAQLGPGRSDLPVPQVSLDHLLLHLSAPVRLIFLVNVDEMFWLVVFPLALAYFIGEFGGLIFVGDRLKYILRCALCDRTEDVSQVRLLRVEDDNFFEEQGEDIGEMAVG